MKSSNLYQAVGPQITYILPSFLLLQDRSQSFLRDCLPSYTHQVGSNKTSISFLSWLLINFSLTNTLIHPSFCAGVSYSYISWIKWDTALGPHFPGEWRCLSALVKELPRVGPPEGLTVQACGSWGRLLHPSCWGVKCHLSQFQDWSYPLTVELKRECKGPLLSPTLSS